MSLSAASPSCPYHGHGIGGRMGRAVPRWAPVLSAITKLRSVMFKPVSLSGVRFAANDTPHGPLHAVFVPFVATSHGPVGLNGAVMLIDSGWPENILVISGSAPFGPGFIGV